MLTFSSWHANSQEWKNMRSYQKSTGKDTLSEGNWLKKDRLRKTDVWNKANAYNLRIDNGNLKYLKISQIRDFYLWFETERIKAGHEITYIGIAQIVAKQLSKLDNGLIRVLIIRNKGVVRFGNEASSCVFEFSFDQMRDVYYSKNPIVGEEAKKWDLNYGLAEQCVILEPIYASLDEKTIDQLLKMAQGKGIYRFGVPKRLKYEGSIRNCEERVAHGLKKIYPYILEKHK